MINLSVWTQKRLFRILTAVILASVFFDLGVFFTKNLDKIEQRKIFATDFQPFRVASSTYSLIDPLLACNFSSSKDFEEFLPLRKKIDSLIKGEQLSDRINKVSVYFREPSGRWFGINENDGYPPASLLKVPIMIAFYSQMEKNPDTLGRSVLVTKDRISEDPTNTLIVGQHYTIQQLIERMIVSSDNNAKNILLQELGDPKYIDEIFSDLGIEKPDGTGTYYISAKVYSYFFRLLYNSTYLNREYSEKALNLLTQATYKGGLVAGIPEVKIIAHKYGKLTSSDYATSGGVDLHDCGIVYSTKGPYFLCIMTKGYRTEDSEKVIQEISHMVNDMYENSVF